MTTEQRFLRNRTGFTRAKGPDFAFQASAYQLSASAADPQGDDSLSPTKMYLTTEYGDRYNGEKPILGERTMRRCFTATGSGRIADGTGSAGDAALGASLGSADPAALSSVKQCAGFTQPLDTTCERIGRPESSPCGESGAAAGGRSLLGGPEAAYARTSTLGGHKPMGGYSTIKEMAAAGKCDEALCTTIRPYSVGNGATGYRTLKAYAPGYTTYRREYPGNYVETQAVDGPTTVSAHTSYVENCKFSTQPYPSSAERSFETTHRHFHKAIHEPDYSSLLADRNEERFGSSAGFRGHKGRATLEPVYKEGVRRPEAPAGFTRTASLSASIAASREATATSDMAKSLKLGKW